MRSTLSSLNSDRGFTLLELLVTSFLGLVITALCLSATTVNRYNFGKDLVRLRMNQNLRGSMDLITMDGKLAGENLGQGFPALEVVNGTSGATDEIVFRRNLVNEVLPLCTTITTGSTNRNIYFAVPGNVAGCGYSGQTQAFNSWKSYRTSNGNSVDAFIYDTATKTGEFFTYQTETDGGTSYYLTRNPVTWSHTYSVGSAAVYILEEWRYKVASNMLQVIQNRDSANPLNVSFNISDFQVVVTMQDGTTKTAFTTADPWTSISTVQVTVTGSDHYAGNTTTKTLSTQFFPRNILSS